MGKEKADMHFILSYAGGFGCDISCGIKDFLLIKSVDPYGKLLLEG